MEIKNIKIAVIPKTMAVCPATNIIKSAIGVSKKSWRVYHYACSASLTKLGLACKNEVSTELT